MIRKIYLPSLTLSLLLIPSYSFAAGFGIIENSASGMGNAFAGAAAVGEDASTVWFNPAAMSLLGDRPTLTNTGHIVAPIASFKNRGSSVNPALTGGDTNAAVATLSGDADSADKVAFIPNLYYVRPLNERMHIGIGINAPFGLEVNYKDDWVGRYLATTSAMKTINVNPSISWKANEQLSLGAGISGQYMDVELGTAIDSAAACRSAAIAANSGALLTQCINRFPNVGQSDTDSSGLVAGDGFAFGFNVGLLYEPIQNTRFGLSYRSKIKQELEGDATFTVDDSLQQIQTSATTNLQQALQATRLRNREITAKTKLPDTLSLSVAHKLNSKLDLLADATWTGWSSFQELRVVEAATPNDTVSVTPEEWNDVWRISVGGNYQYNDRLKLRAGVAYDESPIPGPTLRTPRIPGNDRTWLSIGAGYKVNKKIDVDVGYSHILLDETPIDHTNENGYSLRGVYDADVNILSAQLNYKF